MKHILIPTDLLPESGVIWQHLLRYVTGPLHLHFVHAVDDIFVKEERDHIGAEGVDKITTDLIYKMRAEADKAMEELVQKVTDICRDAGLQVEVEGNVTNGTAEEVILETAARLQPQLIVMGTHDHSKLDRLFFGSVTQSVLRRAHFPVFAIPLNHKSTTIKEVLYLSDLDDEDAYAAGKLIHLFGASPVHLHITHFNLDGTEKDAKLYAIADKVRNDHKEVPIAFEVIDARILRDAYKEYIAANHIDIIALTTRKNHGLSRFLNPGTAVDVLYHSKLPVLVFHKP